MKLNKEGLFAMIGVVFGIGVIVNDLIQIIVFEKSYTSVGIATLFLALVLAGESAKVIEERLNR